MAIFSFRMLAGTAKSTLEEEQEEVKDGNIVVLVRRPQVQSFDEFD